MKTEKTVLNHLSEIRDAKSDYYCGSAIYLRLLPIRQLRKDEAESKEDIYPELEKASLYLYRRDPFAFASSKETDGEKIRWDELTAFFKEEADYRERLRYRIEDLPFPFRTESLNRLLSSSFNVLSSQAKDNLGFFFDFEEADDDFKMAGVSILRIREGRIEPYAPLKKTSDSPDFKAIRQVCSLVPCALLSKLIERKENGKHPFSSSFDVQGKLRELKGLTDPSLLTKEDRVKTAETAFLASEEIKNVSFKQDFIWIKDALECFAGLIG